MHHVKNVLPLNKNGRKQTSAIVKKIVYAFKIKHMWEKF